MARIGVVVLCTFLAGLASPALAQVSTTTGSINGKVSDATGGVLPGVTVTVASPNMQGTRSTVTDEAATIASRRSLPAITGSPTNWRGSARSFAKAFVWAWALPPPSTRR